MNWNPSIEITLKKHGNFLKANVTKDDVEKMAAKIREQWPNAKDENWIMGFAINQAIAHGKNIPGSGEASALLRIENDFAKYLGYIYI
jgi:hypothetical protein